jgi:serine/threonine-protein kinase
MSLPSDWSRVRELFGAALAVPPDVRARFVAESCGGDLALRSRVQRLLASLERAGSFLETPLALGIDTVPARDLAGQRFGPYDMLEAIGAGGMGEVYRARDTRPPPRSTGSAESRCYTVPRNGPGSTLSVGL